MIYIEKQKKLTDDAQSHKNIYIRVEASLTRQTAPDDMHNIFRLEYDMYYVGKPVISRYKNLRYFSTVHYAKTQQSSHASQTFLSSE